ncbi:TSUP family transporter [Rugamonas sp. FT107W]|uniref:Probable membrane transporter protein n=1 Tax=Duganella vulcania TaxID=2692166 RepID=A0A845HEJ6_9BURK|nr:sulfite exporter TauE/SafE family protein [Duganella vulcania]MYN17181.1 TSUP family transporter [Duganella vulcania]
MDLGLVLILLLMGAVGGFMAGLLGIGGGMILVPFITLIFSAQGFPEEAIIHMAVATSLGVILFTSMSSVRAHHRHGAVLWPVALLLAPGILLGAWCGPWIAKQMSSAGQALLFSIFLTFSATQMLLAKKAAPAEGVAQRGLPGNAAMFGAGGVIGLVAGLVGAGGGFLSIPFMTWRNVKIHNAVATSAALGFPIALAGTLSNIYYGWNTPDLPRYSLGFVYMPALLVIAAASVTLAPLGARTAHKLPVQTLRKIFAIVLYCLAAYMLRKAIGT